MNKLSLAIALVVSCSLGLFLWSAVDRTSPRPILSPQELYGQNCAVCHGTTGRGDGQAAEFLEPKPRDFRLGSFRLVSTSNQRPTREDLFRVLTRGMPGTPMPPWAHLTESDRWGLVDYVLKLNREGWIEDALEQGDSPEDAEKYTDKGLRPGDPIVIPPEPERNAESVRLGRGLFIDNCAPCHGADGRGKLDPAWRTAENNPIRSRDFTRGVFKGGRDGTQLFSRIAVGIPGTPMPGFGPAPEYWHIVHYVQSLSVPEAQERATIRPVSMAAPRVKALPEDVQDDRWREVEARRVPLLPMNWAEGVSDEVTVRAVHDGDRIAFLLEWSEEMGETASPAARPPAAAAVRLTKAPFPPLFSDQAGDDAVAVWQWSASAQADCPFGRRFPCTLLSGGHNPKTLEAQHVDSNSDWQGGKWRLQLTRSLKGRGEEDLGIRSGEGLSVAFMIFNGSAQEARPPMAASVWNALRIEK